MKSPLPTTSRVPTPAFTRTTARVTARASMLTTFLAAIFLMSPLVAIAGQEASVYFIAPQDGAVVSSEFTVQFGLKGMGVAPAGVQQDNTGHHHLLIDVDTLPAMDVPLPATDHIKHFGGGQTETTLKLEPGQHTLQLMLGDYTHIPLNPPVMSKKITITVE